MYVVHLQVLVVHLLLLLGRRRWRRFRPPQDAAALRRVSHVVRSVLEFVLPVHVRAVSNQRVQDSLRRTYASNGDLFCLTLKWGRREASDEMLYDR